jgi:uncharacterized protein
MPIDQSGRITALDSLRGIALLGILLVNIKGFGLPDLLVTDISVQKETGLNYFTWYVFGPGVLEGTMRAIFSMLFGSGIIIFINRLEKRKKGLLPLGFFFRRQFWLLLFGLFDIYVLLWYGDILFLYAFFGLLLFPLRKLKAGYLFLITAFCLLLATAGENLELYKQKAILTKGEMIAAKDTTKTKLTDRQKDTLDELNAMIKKSNNKEKKTEISHQLTAMQGNYSAAFHLRTEMATREERTGIYYSVIWDILLFMFLGMAFYKTGILQGEASLKMYMWMAIAGLVIGLPLSYYYLQPELQYHHNYIEMIRHQRFVFYELQRFARSIGVLGLLLFIYKSGWLKKFFALMQPVGQMALTNYLAQSFLCGLFFYGPALGMFGKLQRYELYYVVFVVWIIEIAWSHAWLHRFHFGPCEWLWRSLTYWKKQPLRRR